MRKASGLIILLFYWYFSISICFEINHAGFKVGENIKDRYTPQGEDYNPELSWDDPPLPTKSLALIVEDPDAPKGTWYHWLVYNIDPLQFIIQENTVPGIQVVNSWEIEKYRGPSPPKGQRHRYYFRLYALGVMLPSNIKNIKDLLNEIRKHKIAETSIMGTYESRLNN